MSPLLFRNNLSQTLNGTPPAPGAKITIVGRNPQGLRPRVLPSSPCLRVSDCFWKDREILLEIKPLSAALPFLGFRPAWRRASKPDPPSAVPFHAASFPQHVFQGAVQLPPMLTATCSVTWPHACVASGRPRLGVLLRTTSPPPSCIV